MTSGLGYESVYSFQEVAFGPWCRIEAMFLAQKVTMRREIGGGPEWLAEARRRANEKCLSKHEVRKWLVGAASTGGREIVLSGFDKEGLIAPVVFAPAQELKYEPDWVSHEDNPMLRELLRTLQRKDLPFASREYASASF